MAVKIVDRKQELVKKLVQWSNHDSSHADKATTLSMQAAISEEYVTSVRFWMEERREF